jgi:hypothetical protein
MHLTSKEESEKMSLETSAENLEILKLIAFFSQKPIIKKNFNT